VLSIDSLDRNVRTLRYIRDQIQKLETFVLLRHDRHTRGKLLRLLVPFFITFVVAIRLGLIGYRLRLANVLFSGNVMGLVQAQCTVMTEFAQSGSTQLCKIYST